MRALPTLTEHDLNRIEEPDIYGYVWGTQFPRENSSAWFAELNRVSRAKKSSL